jgi:hypothetical protein
MEFFPIEMFLFSTEKSGTFNFDHSFVKRGSNKLACVMMTPL